MRPYHADPDYYEGRAEGLLASAVDETADAVAAFERHGAPLTMDGARTVLAREHDLADWDALLEHLHRMDDDPFVRAYRALEAHDVDGLTVVVDEHPDVVAIAGTNGNDLLGMASATCDERLVRVLLDRGADVAHANVHGWTALHQTAYSDLPAMARMLLEAGADVTAEARGSGGTPLVVALFWGNRATAELLAERGVHPRNLRTAAGLGLVDEIASAEGGARGFYRPHSGFPAWAPSDDPQEALDEALTWAARNDRVEALDALVARGANVAADVYRGTALSWAAACGRVGAIRRLAELGADVNQRTTFGGPGHAQLATALHLAAQSGHLDAIRALLELGADPAAKDDLYQGTPANWAEHSGNEEAAATCQAVVMDEPLTGGCACGTVRFEVTAPFQTAGYCHCKRCQRRSGALWSENGIVDARAFRLVSGADVVRAWKPPDGLAKSFCTLCGGHVFTGEPGGDGIVGVRLGAVDGDPGIRPQWHQFVESAPDWEPLPDDGLPRFEQRRQL